MYDAFVAYHARMRPRDLAVLTPGRRATYAEFNADVNRFAAAFAALGVSSERGVVRVECPNLYRQLVMLLALARLEVATGVTGDRDCDLTLSERPGKESERVIRLSQDWIAATEAAEPIDMAARQRNPDALARVTLSSGTTKAARRVPSTFRRRMDSALNALGVFGAGRMGVWVIRTGIDSGLGNSLSVLAWTMGAAVATGFETGDLPMVMERNPEGLLGITPVQLRELLRALPRGFAVKPNWRVVVTGGALTPAVARAARSRLSPDVITSYSASETGRAIVGPASLLETTGAVGWPVPGVEAQVVDPDGAPLPDGVQGEIRVRTTRTTGRYLGDDEATRRVFRDEGWVHVGDLGRRLPDGSFVIDGRIDDRMNIGGVKVLPNVMENALMEHPGVRDAAAFTVPDAQGMDQCWMAVVCDGEVSREALMERLRATREPLPSVRFAWADEIPRNAMDKIDRNALRLQTQAALNAGALKP